MVNHVHKLLRPHSNEFSECHEEHDRTGIDYRGTNAETVSGFSCQRWDQQFPNKHNMTAKKLVQVTF
jgi:hypothetical protein